MKTSAKDKIKGSFHEARGTIKEETGSTREGHAADIRKTRYAIQKWIGKN